MCLNMLKKLDGPAGPVAKNQEMLREANDRVEKYLFVDPGSLSVMPEWELNGSKNMLHYSYFSELAIGYTKLIYEFKRCFTLLPNSPLCYIMTVAEKRGGKVINQNANHLQT